MKKALSTVARQYRPWLSTRHIAVCSTSRQLCTTCLPVQRPSLVRPLQYAHFSTRETATSSENPSSTAEQEDTPARPLTDRTDDVDHEQNRSKLNALKSSKPTYQLTFTCAKCLNRSAHLVSKQAYHQGTVLINCPGCKNKHLISDHLGIFSDRKVTLEDILKEKGELLRKGTLGAHGDVEFYPNEMPERTQEREQEPLEQTDLDSTSVSAELQPSKS